jgi:hypothetical protein
MELRDEKIPFILWEQYLTGRITYAKVGEYKGIRLSIRPAEQGHNEPHLHAAYQGKEISISLISFKVLAGNLSPQQQKQAIGWCKNNRKVLEKYWDQYHDEIVA